MAMSDDPTNPRKSSLCLIVCYFGKLPPYVECVFRSCELNPDIDWLILTDDPTPRRLPPNVRLHPATLAGLQKNFSAKLALEVNLTHPRLLCHFKAAYGYLFADLLGKYDFWGHCDLDMVFGNLRKFLREDILRAYDKILCRGHLTLYRNTEKVNRYFMLEAPNTINYREAFQCGRTDHLTFDEWRGIYAILRYHDLPQFHEEFIVDVKPPTRWKITRFEGAAGRNYPEQVFYWHRGRIYHAHYNCDRGIADDEYAYLHFQKRSLPAPEFDPYSAPGFLVTPEGFFPYNREPLTDAEFARFNRERWRTSGEILGVIGRAIGKRLRLLKPSREVRDAKGKPR